MEWNGMQCETEAPCFDEKHAPSGRVSRTWTRRAVMEGEGRKGEDESRGESEDGVSATAAGFALLRVYECLSLPSLPILAHAHHSVVAAPLHQ